MRKYIRDTEKNTNRFIKIITKKIEKEVKELNSIVIEMKNLNGLNDEDALYELNQLSDYFDSTVYRLGTINDKINDYVE